MGTRHELLFETEWVSLWRMKDPERGVGGYVYSHETRSDGRIVAVLPYRFHGPAREYLLRVEVTPCWSMEAVPSAVTGGVDGRETASVAVLRELREETGYDVSVEHLESLGECRGTKSTDTTYYLYAVDVTGMEQGELEGDGSPLEDEATVQWSREPFRCGDPIVSVMYARLSARR